MAPAYKRAISGYSSAKYNIKCVVYYIAPPCIQWRNNNKNENKKKWKKITLHNEQADATTTTTTTTAIIKRQNEENETAHKIANNVC